MLRRLSYPFAFLCAVYAAGAQTAPVPAGPPKNPAPRLAVPPPPVKMGLWENKTTSQIGGFQLPPDVVAKLQAMGRPVPGASPRTMVLHSCLTADEWQKDMERMNDPGKSCKTSNRNNTGNVWSFDLACNGDSGMTMTGHFEFVVADDEHASGKAHMQGSNMGPSGQTITSDITFDSHRLGADCGDIKPGSPKIISDTQQ